MVSEGQVRSPSPASPAIAAATALLLWTPLHRLRALLDLPQGAPAMTDDQVSRMNSRIGAYASSSDGTENLGIDWFEHLQLPMVHTRNDPLATFVMARVRELETEPRGEIKAAYDQAAGPMAHRYAKHVRRDCVVFRQIVAAYLQAHDRAETCEEDHDDPAELSGVMIGLRTALLAVANRWSDHREFDEAWRLT